MINFIGEDAVEYIFDAKVRKVLASKSDFVNFIIKHDRKKVAIENVTKMLKECEWTRPDLLDKHGRRQFIEAAAKMFIEAALEEKRQFLMNHGERSRLSQKNDKFKRAEDMLQDIEKEALDTTLRSYSGATVK